VAEPLKPCAHCGLPARGRYCCFGCELAARIQADARDDHARLYGTFAFTLVLAMLVMMLSLFLYAEDVFDAGGDVELLWMRAAYRWASLVLATPVMALGGAPLVQRAWASLRERRLSMDALIALGAFAAYALSIHNLLARRSGVYFDSATTAVVLATFGRYLEATARSRASRSLGPLVEVARGTVRLHGSDRRVAAAEIEPGMSLAVGAEQVVPVDVALEDESAEVSLAVLSGESRPVAFRRGQTIPAGAVPLGTGLVGRALRASRDSALERLAELARSLSERPSGVMRWADRFAAALTPLVALVALGALVHVARARSLADGVLVALAVVLAACPCSYAIASPLVQWLTLRRAFARGVLVRSPEALEAIARTRVVAFDKTGTLTRPELRVTSLALGPGVTRDEALALAVALEEGCAHPIARALVDYGAGVAPAALAVRRLIAGRGVAGVDDRGRALRLGAGQGTSGAIVLERDGATLAAFELAEELRPEAPAAVRALEGLGVRALVLSGDDDARVDRVARRLGLDAAARLSPEDKLARLAALGDGVAMVGDGVNDAPALAGRLSSFSFGGAAQLAKGVAQVTLLEPDLELVPWTIALARRGTRLVKWLLGCSTAYNLVFVALAAAGALKPVWAGLSMLVSSLLAISFAAGSSGSQSESESESESDLAEPDRC
jgi:heavy metal translocating P-type ATPase